MHHLARIPLLLGALSSSSTSAVLRQVRTLDISLPPSLSSSLSQPIPLAYPAEAAAEERDPLSRPASPSSPITYTQALRSIVLISAPTLLSLSLSGITPSTIFPSPSCSPSSPFAHLQQHRFQHLTSLSIAAPSAGGQHLRAEDLRGPLMALRGLRELDVRGYRSLGSEEEEEVLDLSMVGGALTRGRTLRLRKLILAECCFSREDLLALFEHITPGTLVDLAITETHDPSLPLREAATDEEWSAEMNETTGEFLAARSPPLSTPTSLHLAAVLPLIASSLRSLRVELHNWPSLSTTSPLIPPGQANAGPHGPPRPSPPLSPPSPQAHHIDLHLPQLSSLENLTLAGSACSSRVLDYLPPCVRSLELRGCERVGTKEVKGWLEEVGEKTAEDGWMQGGGAPKMRRKVYTSSLSSPSGSSSPISQNDAPTPDSHHSAEYDLLPLLSSLSIHSSSLSTSLGWHNSEERWGVQKACWGAGVVWRSHSEEGQERGEGEEGDEGW